MTTRALDPRAEIERRVIEFEAATQRAHARFFAASLFIASLVIATLLYGLASWRL